MSDDSGYRPGRLYDTGIHWAAEASTESDVAMSELINTLRQRKDRGRAFWVAVAESLSDVRDREPHRAQPAPQVNGSVVYYLRFSGRIKIGTSANLKKRLQVVPHDELLATEPGGRSLESRRHGQFADSRIVGEWFEPTGRLLRHIRDLKQAQAA